MFRHFLSDGQLDVYAFVDIMLIAIIMFVQISASSCGLFPLRRFASPCSTGLVWKMNLVM